MQFKDTPLKEINQMLSNQATRLSKARFDYLRLDAERQSHEALLIKNANGKSHAEKVTNARADESWVIFLRKLARAEAVFEFEKLKFSILEREWLAIHQSLKMDNGMIKKGSE